MALKSLSFFERYLTLWVLLCIVAGIVLGKLAPGVARTLDGMAVYQVSLPIAVCLFFMMFPIMVKIDFGQVTRAGRNLGPVTLTLVVNWAVKPFTMYAIAWLFLGVLFRDHLPGTEVLKDGRTVELYRSYIAGAILLGIAPCTAMVLMWGYLARGNDSHTLVMVAINALTMLVLYGALGQLLLGLNAMPIPWRTILLSVLIYVGLPLVAGYYTRRWLLAAKGRDWFEARFLRGLTPVSIAALLVTLVLLFSFKGELILDYPLTILWIAVPLTIQTLLIFALTYGLARLFGFVYEDAAPTALIGASNHFEVAIATAAMLFGLASGAALTTVVGVLIEVPLMLLLVRACVRTRHWFPAAAPAAATAEALSSAGSPDGR